MGGEKSAVTAMTFPTKTLARTFPRTARSEGRNGRQRVLPLCGNPQPKAGLSHPGRNTKSRSTVQNRGNFRHVTSVPSTVGPFSNCPF